MDTARVLPFVRRRQEEGSGGSPEPVSPFRHLMTASRLTAAQIQHRQRMLYELAAACRLTVTADPRGRSSGAPGRTY